MQLVTKKKLITDALHPSNDLTEIDEAVDAVYKAVTRLQELVHTHQQLLTPPATTPNTKTTDVELYSLASNSSGSSSEAAHIVVPAVLGSTNSNTELTLAKTFSFRGIEVNSIGVINQDLFVALEDGIKRIGSTCDVVVDSFGSNHVALAQIDSSRVLVSTPDCVEVHKIGDLFRDRPIFVLPPTLDGDAVEEIISVGVSGSCYFLADRANNLIHVWCSRQKRWMAYIDVENLSECRNPSFKMSVYSDRIYISLYHEGHILAMDRSGQVIWRNTTAVPKPNGLFAHCDGIFVCNPSQKNIVVDRKSVV